MPEDSSIEEEGGGTAPEGNSRDGDGYRAESHDKNVSAKKQVGGIE